MLNRDIRNACSTLVGEPIKKRTLKRLMNAQGIIPNTCREIWCEQIGTNIPEEPVVHLLEY
jgi:hypothetical protein